MWNVFLFLHFLHTVFGLDSDNFHAAFPFDDFPILNREVRASGSQRQHSQLQVYADEFNRIITKTDYDTTIRPGLGGPAVPVAVAIHLLKLTSLSELSMQYTAIFHLYQNWSDPRLAFSGNDDDHIVLAGDYAAMIWTPDTMLANDRSSYFHTVTLLNQMVRVSGVGSVLYASRITATLSCTMQLQQYPHDQQRCNILLKSFAYSDVDMRLHWNGELSNAVSGFQNFKLQQFSVSEPSLQVETVHLPTGSYDQIGWAFRLERKIGHFVISVFFPSISIVAVSWNCFWLDLEANSARVGLGISTVLTLSLIDSNVRSSLPQVDYAKAIDIYLLTCFMFVFATLIEYAAIDFFYWKRRLTRKSYDETNRQWREANKIVEARGTDSGEWRRRERAALCRQENVNSVTPSVSMLAVDDIIESGSDEDLDPQNIIGLRSDFSHVERLGRYQFARNVTTVKPRSFSRLLTKRKRQLFSYINQRVHCIKIKKKEGEKFLPFSENERDAVARLDKWSRILFPVCFGLFNAGYWAYYTQQVD